MLAAEYPTKKIPEHAWVGGTLIRRPHLAALSQSERDCFVLSHALDEGFHMNMIRGGKEGCVWWLSGSVQDPTVPTRRSTDCQTTPDRRQSASTERGADR